MRILMVSCGGVAAQRLLEWVVKAGHEVWLLGDKDFYPENTSSNYRYAILELKRTKEAKI